MAIGRIERGVARVGDTISLLPMDLDTKVQQSKITKLFGIEGLDRIEIESAPAGEVVALAGLDGVEGGFTFTHINIPQRLAGIPLAQPTRSGRFAAHTSPYPRQDPQKSQ